jgi:hypothetical protein
MKIRRRVYSCAASLEGCSAIQSSVNAPLVVIGGESVQLSMQVETVPEEGLVEILAPKGSDEPLDERMRARHERDRLEFLNVDFVERQIKQYALGRKLWMFVYDKVGAQASANLFSLVMTARANGVEPFEYLSDLFELLPTAATVEAVESLLPWNLKSTTAARSHCHLSHGSLSNG